MSETPAKTWSDWTTVSGDGFDNFETITYEKKSHLTSGANVARISFNRPDRMNAMTAETGDELFRAFYDASHDTTIGAIILAGRGKNFGTGGDVIWEQWGLRSMIYNRYPANRLVRMARQPVIAQVQGYCIGGHNHLAYCCDFTIAADNAIFGQAGPRVSSPADGFFVPYLTKVVGAKKARELWMLCRKYKAEEALQMGLVNTVVPLDQLEAEVDRWCEDILRLSPGCLEILKVAFDQEMDGYKDLGAISAQLHPHWFDTPEGKEGGAAFVEKRPSEFWRIRSREVEARKEALDDYLARQKRD